MARKTVVLTDGLTNNEVWVNNNNTAFNALYNRIVDIAARTESKLHNSGSVETYFYSVADNDNSLVAVLIVNPLTDDYILRWVG